MAGATRSKAVRPTRGTPWPRASRPPHAAGAVAEVLERRQLFAAAAASAAAAIAAHGTDDPHLVPAYLPPQVSLTPSAAPAGFAKGAGAGLFLSAPVAGKPLAVAKAFLSANAAALGVRLADVANPLVTDQYTDADTGVTHIYLRQQVNGLPVVNANLSVHLTADNQLISVAGGFIDGLAAAVGTKKVPGAAKPGRSAVQAVKDAAQHFGLKLPTGPKVLQSLAGVARQTKLKAAGASLDDVPATLHYVATPTGLKLAWDVVFRTPDGDHWYDASVNTATGKVVAATDWVDHASYTVFAVPIEAPNDGSRVTLTDPQDTTQSPFGWHDTNGAAGAEFTVTRGNNAYAYLDRDANDVVDANGSPDGGAALAFNPTLTLTSAPTTTANQQSAVTNLFYVNNLLHDVHARYGFTSAAGNFQTSTYGAGGAGADAVLAEAQDGEGTNNANFATPPDGTAPRMQMFLFNLTSPNRDGDLDNGIIIHEYGHGVSTRLTGGPANASSLDNLQSGGMGEGWSDFWSLMFTQRATDVQNQAYPVGTYVLNNTAGIRRRPYSFDKTIDPLTFEAFGTSGATSYGLARSTEVHDSGELWTSALWDLNWLLINKYGYSPTINQGYNAGTAGQNGGNNLTLRLVMDALKLQPANPSFTQARDAILTADTALTGGANQLDIWKAFARRGLGFSASTASSNATALTPAFDLPPALTGARVTAQSPVGSTSPPVDHVDLTFNEAVDPASFSVAADVASFTAPDGTDLKSAVTGFSFSGGNTVLRINFPAQSALGTYTLTVGPQILDATGKAMDQDQDGTVGEATEDQYAGSFLLAAPSVVSSSPGNLLAGPVSAVAFTFNQVMDPASFSVAQDVSSFVGPAGDLKSTISGFAWSAGNTVLTVSFAAQSAQGQYTMIVGPQITNAGGLAMNQDGDKILGEATDDQYFAAVRISPALGADAFGYVAVANAPLAIDLVAGGAGVVTLLGNALDDEFASIPLGTNTFRFYGTQYAGSSPLYVSTNGVITFGSPTTEYINTDLTAVPPQATIAALWDDLITLATGDSSVLYRFDDTTGDAVPDRLVVEWNNVASIDPTLSSGTGTFQAILALNTGGTSGDVILNYPDLDFGTSTRNNGAVATVGIKAAGTQAADLTARRLLVSLNTGASPFVATGTAVRLTTTDLLAPAVTTAALDFAHGGSKVVYTFNERVAAGLLPANLTLVRAGGGTYTASGVTLSADGKTATYDFSALPNGRLPDGSYTATLSTYADATGNAAGSFTFNLFQLVGDLDRDRGVGFVDFNLLLANYGKTGQTYAGGDVDGDGSVGFVDFNLLLANYGKTV
jgi:extracellular elastinolytic metalloproteinase